MDTLGRSMKRGEIKRTQKTCAHCGAIFYVPTRVQLERQKYCSQGCMAKAQTGREWRKADLEPTARKCELCGIDFIGKTPRARFCSNRCSGTAFARKQTAENADLRGHLTRLLKMSGYERSELSLDLLLALYEKQDGQCALTGITMTWKARMGRVQTNISIDRISVLCGYTPDNVQLVCRMANIMKGELSQSDFLAVCRRVIAKADGV